VGALLEARVTPRDGVAVKHEGVVGAAPDCGRRRGGPQRMALAQELFIPRVDDEEGVGAERRASAGSVREQVVGPRPDGIRPTELVALDAAVRERFRDGDALPRERPRFRVGDRTAVIDVLLALLAKPDGFALGRRERLPALGAGEGEAHPRRVLFGAL